MYLIGSSITYFYCSSVLNFLAIHFYLQLLLFTLPLSIILPYSSVILSIQVLLAVLLLCEANPDIKPSEVVELVNLPSQQHARIRRSVINQMLSQDQVLTPL